MKDKTIKEINRIFHEEEALFYDQRHPEIAKEKKNWSDFCQKFLVPKIEASYILDVGSGTGFVPAIIASYLTSKDLLVCTDISRQMLTQAREKLKDFSCRVDFVETDCEQMFFAKSSFDLITINSVLHHLPNFESFLQQLSGWLRPNGLLVIMHEPNRRFYQNVVLFYIFKIISFLRFKFKGNSQSQKPCPDLLKRVCYRLQEEKIVKEPISPDKLVSFVDIWSPTASYKINKALGFDPFKLEKDVSPCLSLISLKTYSHLGKIDSADNIFFSGLEKILAFLFPRDGSSFSLIFKKI